MRNHTRVSVVAVCLAMFPAAAGAQTQPSTPDVSWEKVVTLPLQTPVTVVLENGKKRKFRFAGASEDGLRLLGRNGQEEILAKREVAQVFRRGVEDPVGDGALAGAATGAATTALLTGVSYLVCQTYSSRCYSRGAGQAIAIAAGAGAAAGAGIGWVIDKLHKGTEEVFSAPPGRGVRIDVIPVVGARERRVLLSVGF